MSAVIATKKINGVIVPVPCVFHNARRGLGLLPPPRAPGLPGSRIILRKSGKPDLRWRRGGEGGRSCCARCVHQHRTPPPTPSPQGGGEHTEFAARPMAAHDSSAFILS